MIETFLSTLSPMLIMFSCLLIGYILNKTKVLPENSANVMARLETYVFMPALGFSTFMKYCTVRSLTENRTIFPFSLLAIVLAVVIAIPLSKMFEGKDLYKRNIYKYAFVFANHGFIGNAIVPMILGGDKHLYTYLLFTLPLNFLTYLWGISILTPKEHRKKSVIANFVNAPMIALILGAVAGLSGIGASLPDFVTVTVDNLQKCMGPVAMLLSGFIIGGYPIKSLLSDKKLYAATFLRLLILPTVILTVLRLCGANWYLVTLALFAYATPLGLNTIVIPAAYDGETKTGASMTMISHALCVISIPLMNVLLNLVQKI